VVIVVLHGGARAAVCAHLGLEHVVLPDCERSQIERVCDSALAAPDRHTATRLLALKLKQLTTAIPGLRNSGLFAMHELEYGVPRRADWDTACSSSRKLLNERGRDLITKLGYRIQETPKPVSVLLARGT
jgi:hypothetical protein